MKLLACLIALPLFAQTPNGDDLLMKVDRLRHPWPNFSMELSLKDGKSEQRWKVLARENGDARVEGLSEKEKGRAVLVLGESMWLLLPTAKKPVKISPQQRLMGPASGGDIARSRFRDDYSVESTQEVDHNDTQMWELSLRAKRPSVSYRSVKLYVGKADELPKDANFLLASGKAAKKVAFVTGGNANGKAVLLGMDVKDGDGRNATQLRFDHWTPATVDPKYFELPAQK
jgi:outer membrane lipoprotein-sorting protein